MLNLQDLFLNQLRKDRTVVTVYLTNGFQLRGCVRGFDSFTIILENEGRQNLIYKNAISTITPTHPVRRIAAPGVRPRRAAGSFPGCPGSGRACGRPSAFPAAG